MEVLFPETVGGIDSLRSEVSVRELGIEAVIGISSGPRGLGNTLGHFGVAAVAFWFLETG